MVSDVLSLASILDFNQYGTLKWAWYAKVNFRKIWKENLYQVQFLRRWAATASYHITLQLFLSKKEGDKTASPLIQTYINVFKTIHAMTRKFLTFNLFHLGKFWPTFVALPCLYQLPLTFCNGDFFICLNHYMFLHFIILNFILE